jgi:hypothetical protein
LNLSSPEAPPGPVAQQALGGLLAASLRLGSRFINGYYEPPLRMQFDRPAPINSEERTIAAMGGHSYPGRLRTQTEEKKGDIQD